MDKETEKVIKNIAEIQIEALSRIIANEDKPNSALGQELILKLLEFDESCIPDEVPMSEMRKVFKEVIHEETQKRIDIYKQILEIPTAIRTLNEYQLYTCSHILWKMEDVWVLDNQQGVLGAWAELQACTNRLHPELTLILN